MNIELSYVLFTAWAMAMFRILRPATAALMVFLGGWLLLPVGNYPPGSAEAVFPYWITGLAVPSNMLLTKAWVAPAAAVLGVLLFDRAALLRLRFGWADVPITLWCLWPLVQPLAGLDPRPGSGASSLYLVGCWGLPWLLGRLYCATPAGQLLLLKAVAVAGVACLPFALVEGVAGPVIYGWIYDLHPFRMEGGGRYLGLRPLGFFENGNQYGLWVSLCALAGVWVAWSHRSSRRARFYKSVAIAGVVIALAAQSVGSILLLAAGLLFLAATRMAKPRWLLLPPLVLLSTGGAIYLSGLVPITQIGKGTVAGAQVVEAFRSMGRASFPWRISQDQKLLESATERPLTGTADWSWWREKEVRPWGLALLLVGQFGIAGMLLAFAALLAPALRCTWLAPRGSPWRPEAAPLVLAVIVGLAALDALLNSFIFFPALVMSGGMAGSLSAASYGNKH